MRYLLTILCFITLQASGQALFHAHNKVSATVEAGLPVTSGLYAWWDAGYGVTGSPVTSWEDKSGNGHTLTATTGMEPTYTAVGKGGKPQLYFAMDKGMRNTAFILSQPFTFFIVTNSDAFGGTYRAFFYSINTGNYFMTTSSAYQLNIGSSYPAFGPTDLTHTVHVLSQGGGALELHHSHMNELVGTASIDGTGINGLYIGYAGSQHYLSGNVSEIIFYNRVLTATERESVVAYLTEKYALP